MREVEQVVVDELIVGAEMMIALDRGPLRIVHPMKIRNAGGVGERSLAHPDPREGVPLNQRIFTHPRPLRHSVLAGHAHAGAVTVEAQSVIAALDRLADHASEGERSKAMRAAVSQRYGIARWRAEKHDRLALHRARERGR